MNFATLAIRRPIPPILFFMLFTLAGLWGFNKLPIQHFPDMDFPTVIVKAGLPGATPSALENEVTRPIEDSLSNIDQIKHINSTITNGMSTTVITFDLEKSSLQAVSDVRNSIEQARSILPPAMLPPIISRLTTSGGAILTFVLESDYLSELEQSWFIDNDIKKSLLGITGVGSISRLGGVDREYRIELKPESISSTGLTAMSVSRQIKGLIEEKPGGQVALGDYQQSIRAVSAISSLADLEKLPIHLNDGSVVQVDKIANVIDGSGERHQMALVDGRPVVGFSIQKAQGHSEIAVANAVREAINALNASHTGITIEEVNNTINPVMTSYNVAMDTLYEGAILAVIAVFVFLKDIRATFVAAVALPLSIIPTFAIMYLLDFQLNSISLLSITLIIGVLVDDAIVEIENIERHLAMGLPPLKAAMVAANEIGLAVIATSFTLIAVFLPTAFMSGLAGLFFKQFGWTASIAVFFSLLVARLLTPLMAAYFMKAKGHIVEEQVDSPLKAKYLALVKLSLNYPMTTVSAAGLFLIGSFVVLMQLPTNFVDAEDYEQVIVQIETPPGARLEKTQLVAQQVSEVLQGYPEVSSVFAHIGADRDQTKAKLTAQLTPLAGPSRATQQEIEARLKNDTSHIPGVRLAIGGGSTGTQTYEIRLVGTDAKALTSAINDITSELRQQQGIGRVWSTAGLQLPEVTIQPNYTEAASLGVSAEAISQATRVGFSSDYDQYLPRINLTERQIYVKTQLPLSSRERIENLEKIMVQGTFGLVPLRSVADFSISGGPAKIERLDRLKSFAISIDTENKPLSDIEKVVNQLDSLKKLPAGVSRKTSGSSEQQQEIFEGFGLAILAGILCVYAVLVFLFHDFLQPITILTAMPLSSGGAFTALALTGHSLSLSSLIGLIMLMGIVSKNSILLVDFIIQSREERQLNREDAVIDACRKRARPVIMTSIAMIAGMLPMALQLGVPSAFSSPMAIAVIGGLITSTCLSLVVVPVIYVLIDRIKQRIVQKLQLDGHNELLKHA